MLPMTIAAMVPGSIFLLGVWKVGGEGGGCWWVGKERGVGGRFGGGLGRVEGIRRVVWVRWLGFMVICLSGRVSF